MPSAANVSRTYDAKVDGILWGTKWADSSLTYSFPDSASDYSYSSIFGLDLTGSFSGFNSAQQAAATYALDTSDGNTANDGFAVEGFTNLSLSYDDSGAGTLRYANTSASGLSTAFGLPPGTATDLGTVSEAEGDMWFRTSTYSAPQAGNYSWATVLHETGHALGLSHPHQNLGGFGTVPYSYDAMEYTIMSYRSYVGASTYTGYTNDTWSYAQSYMMLDIAALQHMYGADFNTNSGDTIYKWDPNSGDTLINGSVAIDAGGNVIFATIWDGGGTDTYDLSAYSSNLNVNLTPGGYSNFGSSQTANLGRGNYAKGNIYNALQYQGDERSLIENVIAGSGNDSVTGNAAANTLHGEGGNDTLSGGGGGDRLWGGTGNDSLLGGDGNDRLWGMDGSDRQYGGEGNDQLWGGQGADRLYGEAGADTLDGGWGDDLVSGGGGDDQLLGGIGADTLSGGDGHDTLWGGGGDDELNGNDGADRQHGGEGHDSLLGGTGSDSLYGDGGSDTLDGGWGDDKLWGGDGNDLLLGDTGADTLSGGNGNDTLRGGGGDDRLWGWDGSDMLEGGNGHDLLMGGNGADSLYGEGGADTLDGGMGDDQLTGGGGNDRLLGGIGADTLTGGIGHDTLLGGGGDDQLLGSEGADWLYGEKGADTLDGGAGNDVLAGGDYTDTFVFNKGYDADRITDFGLGNDSLLLSGFSFSTELDALGYATEVSGNVFFDFGDGDTLTLLDLQLQDLNGHIFFT
ncbi:M10 family metallopeptidase [Leisingera sp. ANG-M7]|uniref:M10 family metallopeptidase n=1 Tax=Leisingera sp. ANG-M7 TaxID=1577902 RepID=UPI00068C0AC6|nr:M10 family metallopeptidase [Leisingera sp. ANG-M7]